MGARANVVFRLTAPDIIDPRPDPPAWIAAHED